MNEKGSCDSAQGERGPIGPAHSNKCDTCNLKVLGMRECYKCLLSSTSGTPLPGFPPRLLLMAVAILLLVSVETVPPHSPRPD